MSRAVAPTAAYTTCMITAFYEVTTYATCMITVAVPRRWWR